MKFATLATFFSAVAAQETWTSVAELEAWYTTNNAVSDDSYITNLALTNDFIGECTACDPNDINYVAEEVFENSFIQIYWEDVGTYTNDDGDDVANSIQWACIDGCSADEEDEDASEIELEVIGTYTYAELDSSDE